jgi:hypothetical protein
MKDIEQKKMNAKTRKHEARLQKFENDANELRCIYWFIRWCRLSKDRRRHYRRAQKEKARLAGLGYQREVIRLYCLSMKNPKNEARRKRFEEYFVESLYHPRQLQVPGF